MDKKNKLLIIGLMVIIITSIIVTLPSVTSHYVGSHTWYAQPKCTGCHKQQKLEIESVSPIYLNSLMREFHRATNNEACLLCHRTGNFTEIYDGNNNCGNCHVGTPPETPMHGHNVTIHNCSECHLNPTFNIGSTTNATIKMYYAVLWLKNGSAHQLMANQKGCLACHTGINVNITFTDMYTELVINFNSSSKDVKLSFGGSATSSWLVKGADKK